MQLEELRKDPMMDHLIDALDQKQDIGHYGRLVFTLVARHFMSEDELSTWLAKDPACSEEDARGLIAQVQDRNYNPPKRERILEWMERQGFPLCPDPDNPAACNVYRNLNFPDEVYQNIGNFHAATRERE
jgi:hypothetical protein